MYEDGMISSSVASAIANPSPQLTRANTSTNLNSPVTENFWYVILQLLFDLLSFKLHGYAANTSLLLTVRDARVWQPYNVFTANEHGEHAHDVGVFLVAAEKHRRSHFKIVVDVPHYQPSCCRPWSALHFHLVLWIQGQFLLILTCTAVGFGFGKDFPVKSKSDDCFR